eukprot:scaffold162543_cov19-Prasinocladus_malaysianus.AAC.1
MLAHNAADLESTCAKCIYLHPGSKIRYGSNQQLKENNNNFTYQRNVTQQCIDLDPNNYTKRDLQGRAGLRRMVAPAQLPKTFKLEFVQSPLAPCDRSHIKGGGTSGVTPTLTNPSTLWSHAWGKTAQHSRWQDFGWWLHKLAG